LIVEGEIFIADSRRNRNSPSTAATVLTIRPNLPPRRFSSFRGG